MQIDTLTIVGVGLLGGSIGLAVQARGLVRRVVGVGRDRERLEAAQAAGIITTCAQNLADGVRHADLVIFCTPVDRIAEQVIEAAAFCRPGAILSDVGSTKANIISALSGRLPSELTFVGAHPLAGAEKSGAEFARADLFDNRVVIITPTLSTPANAVKQLEKFWQGLGSQVIRMSPEEHDRAVATTSHVPHAVASALAGCLPVDMFELAASGFRDTTRIAAGDPELWAAIFQANRPAVLAGLQRFVDHLDEFRKLLEHDDGPGLMRYLAEGKRVRDALGS
jgi:cyclohexadieny/prephenate dehydrogenase